MGKLIKATILSVLLLGIAVYILVSTFAPGDTPREKVKNTKRFTKKELAKAKEMLEAAMPEPAPEDEGGGLSAILKPGNDPASPGDPAPPKEVEVIVAGPEKPAQNRRPGTPAEKGESVPEMPLEATSAPGTPPEPRSVMHTIAEGENLRLISERYYGSSGQWKRILEANPGLRPEALPIGKKIKIPTENPAETEEEISPAESAEPVVRDTVHDVRKGETLYGIAKRHLGDGNRWMEIVEANPGLDPDALQVGQRIRIPGGSGR